MAFTGNPDWGLSNTGPFQNMQSKYFWSSAEYAPDSSLAWHFRTDYGYQVPVDKINAVYAVAVRPGDVAAAPEPTTLALLGLGLAGLGFSRRKL